MVTGRRKIYFLLFISSFFLAISCKQKEKEPTTNESVKAYLTKIMEPMKLNALNKKQIDWNSFYEKVYDKAKTAKTIDEQPVTEAIGLALTLLGDQHSYFITNSGKYILGSGRNDCSPKQITLPIIPQSIGYLKIDGFSGQGQPANSFAEKLHNEIKKQDNAEIKGWIVDLRGNTGGNMWPMVSGASPLLGNGIIGYFIDYEGNTSPWNLTNGVAAGIEVSNPYQVINPNNKIAVLTDNATASSGEATAIAFSGRANTKSFGEGTCGVSTAVQGFPFADGALLGLTVSIMADRTKKMYGKTITPDVIETNYNQQVKKAIDWILAK